MKVKCSRLIFLSLLSNIRSSSGAQKKVNTQSFIKEFYIITSLLSNFDKKLRKADFEVPRAEEIQYSISSVRNIALELINTSSLEKESMLARELDIRLDKLIEDIDSSYGESSIECVLNGVEGLGENRPNFKDELRDSKQ